MLPPPPRTTLFPYTTLFRSGNAAIDQRADGFCKRSVEFGNADLPDRLQKRSEEHTLNSSHLGISYAVFCLKKKKKKTKTKLAKKKHAHNKHDTRQNST